VAQEPIVGSSPFNITVRDRNYNEIRGVGGYLNLELTLTDPCYAVSEWTIKLPASHPVTPLLHEDGAGIVVRPVGSSKVILSGQMKRATRDFAINDGVVTDGFTFYGKGDEFALLKELAFATSNVDISTSGLTQTPNAYSRDVRVPAETAILNVVRANISSTANITRRRYAWLTVPASQGRGATVTRSDRFPTILETVQKLAILGGLTFSVRQAAQGQVAFTVRVPAVRPEARWSPEAGNIAGFTHTKVAPEVDEAIGAGGGELEDRLFTRRVLANSAAAWGHRSVVFVDQRQTSEYDEIQEALAEEIENGRAVAGLTIRPYETPGLRYGEHYETSDIGTVAVGPVTITDRIRQVVIRHTAGSAPQVSPSVGEPDPAESPQWKRATDRLGRYVSLLRRR
jgi:hypothetical protein